MTDPRVSLKALLAFAGLMATGLVAACSAPAPGEAARSTSPQADPPASFSPSVNPPPLPDRPLARAAFVYGTCNPINVEDDDCRFRLVLTDGSQYTLPKTVMHEGPGPISPDGAFLMLYDESAGLVLRDLPSGTSRTVDLPDHLGAWGPVFWSPGARWAAVSTDSSDGRTVVVDIAGASVRQVADPAGDGAELVAVSAHGDPIWARPADAGATSVSWIGGGRQPVVVDLRTHLRPGETVNPSTRPGEVMLGDGITAAVPVVRAGGDAPWADGDAILLVDVTTGVVRHRLDLPAGTARVRLQSSGCGLGPDALVQVEGDDSADLVALDPWTGARGRGHHFSPEEVPLLIC